MKIYHKLTLAFLSLTILIWITGLMAVRASRNELEAHFRQSSKAMAQNMLHEIEEHLYHKIDTFREYTRDELLIKTLMESNSRFESMSDYHSYIARHDALWTFAGKDEITPFMHKLLDSPLSKEISRKADYYSEAGSSVFSEVFVTNRYGAIAALTGKTTDYRQDDEKWWSQAEEHGVYISDIAWDESAGVFAVSSSLRVNDKNGDLLGVIKVVINIDSVMHTFNEIHPDSMHLRHKSMITRLITKDGRLIYSSAEDERFLQDISSIYKNVESHLDHDKEHDPITDTVIKKEPGGEELYIIHAHSTGYDGYPGLGWILLMEHRADEIFSPLQALKKRILGICLVVMIIAIALTLLISKSITRPVMKLRNAAVNIGRGDLDTRIDISSEDEIGELAAEFSRMAENLKLKTVKLDAYSKEVEERRKAEEMLRQSERDWEDTFDTITDIITIHDKNYNIIRTNRAGASILNLPDSAIIKGAKCHRYYHGTEKPPEGCPSCNCYNTRQPATFELFEPHLNAFVEIKSIPRFGHDGELAGLIHVARDITKRKNDEQMIQTQLQKISALRSIDRAIIGTLDLHVMLDIFLEKTLEQLKIDAATVLMLNRHTSTLDFVASSGFRSEALSHTNLRVGESNAGRAAMERRIVYIANLMEDKNGLSASRFLQEEGFVSYFAVPLIAKGQVKGVLELFNRAPFTADTEWIEFLETIANQGALAIDNYSMFDELQKSNMELTLAYDSTIEGWSRAMDMRDRETEGHSRRVADMTVRIARELGINNEDLLYLRRGAYLHDMGKMAIPDSILLKPGKLTEEEWKIMKMHPVYAHEMLSPIAYLKYSLDIPYYHHEKWDGTGYPRGLKGTEIPVGARIFAIVDVWDALRSDRPYRPAWPSDKVYDYITEQAGSHFDPSIVKVFLKVAKVIDNTLSHSQYLSSSAV